MNKKILCLIVLLCTVTLTALYAQEKPAENALPEPYKASEFPEWLNLTRRFEIIAVGVFPIMLFYTRFSFDMYRYISNGFDSVYAPWPFKNEFSYKPTDSEQYQSVMIAGIASLIFAGVDIFLYIKKQERNSKD